MPSRLSRILSALVVAAALVTVGSLVIGVGSFALRRMIGTNEGDTCTEESRAEILRLGHFEGSDLVGRPMSGASDVCTARDRTAGPATEVLNHFRRQLRTEGWRVRVQSGRHGEDGPCAGDSNCKDGHLDATRAGRCHAITTETFPKAVVASERTSIFIASGRCDQMRD